MWGRVGYYGLWPENPWPGPMAVAILKYHLSGVTQVLTIKFLWGQVFVMVRIQEVWRGPAKGNLLALEEFVLEIPPYKIRSIHSFFILEIWSNIYKRVLNLSMLHYAPFTRERDHSEEDCCWSWNVLWCCSSWEHNPLYWKCLLILLRHTHRKWCLHWLFFSRTSSTRNGIGTICEKLKNSKNVQDQNEKHLSLIFWQEKKITRISWGTESTVRLPLRDVNLLNQDLPRLHALQELS